MDTSKSRHLQKYSSDVSMTACREANYSRDTIIDMRDDSSSIDNRNIVDLNSRRTARISRKVSNSREARNISRDACNIRDISRSRYSQLEK
jgi:hypothetical protein